MTIDTGYFKIQIKFSYYDGALIIRQMFVLRHTSYYPIRVLSDLLRVVSWDLVLYTI